MRVAAYAPKSCAPRVALAANRPSRIDRTVIQCRVLVVPVARCELVELLQPCLQLVDTAGSPAGPINFMFFLLFNLHVPKLDSCTVYS